MCVIACCYHVVKAVLLRVAKAVLLRSAAAVAKHTEMLKSVSTSTKKDKGQTLQMDILTLLNGYDIRILRAMQD